MRTYWYIKHKLHGALRVTPNSYTIGEWDGWCGGITDITIFPNRDLAMDNIKALRRWLTEKQKKNFVLVKVNVK
jgi:hypothetical protein